jgi:hypothetical protein
LPAPDQMNTRFKCHRTGLGRIVLRRNPRWGFISTRCLARQGNHRGDVEGQRRLGLHGELLDSHALYDGFFYSYDAHRPHMLLSTGRRAATSPAKNATTNPAWTTSALDTSEARLVGSCPLTLTMQALSWTGLKLEEPPVVTTGDKVGLANASEDKLGIGLEGGVVVVGGGEVGATRGGLNALKDAASEVKDSVTNPGPPPTPKPPQPPPCTADKDKKCN